jgi:uncharacterized protein
MKNLLEFLLIHLVDHPEDVSVESHEDERGTVFTLHVHPEDMGRVIGKGGVIIQSIRNVAKIRAIKEGIRAQIILAEAEPIATEHSEATPAEEAPQAETTEAAPEATSDSIVGEPGDE